MGEQQISVRQMPKAAVIVGHTPTIRKDTIIIVRTRFAPLIFLIMKQKTPAAVEITRLIGCVRRESADGLQRNAVVELCTPMDMIIVLIQTYRATHNNDMRQINLIGNSQQYAHLSCDPTDEKFSSLRYRVNPSFASLPVVLPGIALSRFTIVVRCTCFLYLVHYNLYFIPHTQDARPYCERPHGRRVKQTLENPQHVV